MKPVLLAFLIYACGLMSVPSPRAGAAETYKVDPVHSSVVFRISHLGFSYTYGRFNDISGVLCVDESDVSKCFIHMNVKVASIDTHNAERDKHLLGPEFFDANKFPLISFKSKSVRTLGNNRYEVTGDFSLHGVTRAIKVIAEHVGKGNDPWGGYRRGFECVFTIKRSDYGMKQMLGPVGDEVRIFLSVEAVRK